eukprot:11863375-Alexandrium_andersonii.AAC.1
MLSQPPRPAAAARPGSDSRAGPTLFRTSGQIDDGAGPSTPRAYRAVQGAWGGTPATYIDAESMPTDVEVD